MELLNILGSNIMTLRNKEKLTQEQLADKATISRITLSSIERGEISPTLETVNKISKALNVQIESLFSKNSVDYSRVLLQPYEGTLGDTLNNMIRFSEYKHLYISCAYAKFSGISRLKESIDEFKSKGGKLFCFIGIDQHNTSYEALCMLRALSDELYIVHNSNLSHTFHPKIYMMDNNSNNNTAWMAIGSNNLTAGGLYINYEACSINTLDLNKNNDNKTYTSTLNVFDRFRRASELSDSIVLKIVSDDNLNELFVGNYVKREQDLHQYTGKSIQHNSSTKTLFGSEIFHAPTIDNSQITLPFYNQPSKNTPDIVQLNDNSTDYLQTDSSEITQENSDINNDIGDIFWFEMRKSTGGSRNILDLSSTAVLQAGSVINTKYDLNQESTILGGVAFFGLNPSEHHVQKDISIVYKGNIYSHSTILFADNNQSWRLQLKGSSSTDSKALSQYGNSDFANHILLFKKFSDTEYALSTIKDISLSSIKQKSVFHATNGISSKSKSFGKIKI